VFSLPVGRVSDPVLSPAGYHLVEATVREEGVAEARHILVPIAKEDDSELALLTLADSLDALGMVRTLDAAARELGLPVLEGVIADDSAFLEGVGNASEGQDWIFLDEEGVGAVSPVFEANLAYYMLEIVGLSPAGHLLLEEVSGSIGANLRAERKRERVLEEARGWVAEIRNGTSTLETLALSLGVEVATAGPFTRQESVPGLGLRTPAVGAAFGAPVGTVVGPVMGAGGVVLLRVDERVEADRVAWEAQKESQRNEVTSQLRQNRLVEWVDGLRETTRIIDGRDAYFRAAEEQQELQSQYPLPAGY
jgi:peptidyl-prolyl cis-trans isomerase D